jgi:hypothetical protein
VSAITGAENHAAASLFKAEGRTADEARRDPGQEFRLRPGRAFGVSPENRWC